MHSIYTSASSHEVSVVDIVLVNDKECNFLDDAVTFNNSSDSQLQCYGAVSSLSIEICSGRVLHRSCYG